ncbi:MAG: hypothetical protein M3N33_00485 [Actinomycetota bacterium]|nr:hypothetical protein [Actinomycetota bacterium]
MDVERASASIDDLIARRAGARSNANELEEFWRRSEVRHREKLRRENAALWYSFYLGLAEAHAKIAAGFEEKAAALLEEEA